MFFRKKKTKNFTELLLNRNLDYNKRAEAALSIGGTKEAKYLDPLIFALENDPEPSVRMNSAFALGQLCMKASKEPLLKALQEDGSEWVRSFCASALTNLDIDFSGIEDILINMLETEIDAGARRHYAYSLGKIGSKKSNEVLISMLRNDLNIGVREDAAEALGMIGDIDSYEVLKFAADNDISAEVRRQAFAAYKKIEEKQTIA